MNCTTATVARMSPGRAAPSTTDFPLADSVFVTATQVSLWAVPAWFSNMFSI